MKTHGPIDTTIECFQSESLVLDTIVGAEDPLKSLQPNEIPEAERHRFPKESGHYLLVLRDPK